MPVTWYEARPDSPGGSITDCDWSAVSGHEVVIWLDDDSAASGRVELVSRMVEEAGAASVRIVESSIPVGDDRDVLLSALESHRPAGTGAGSSAGRDDHGDREERTGVSRQESGPDHLTLEGEEMSSVSEGPEPCEQGRGRGRQGWPGARTGSPRHYLPRRFRTSARRQSETVYPWSTDFSRRCPRPALTSGSRRGS